MHGDSDAYTPYAYAACKMAGAANAESLATEADIGAVVWSGFCDAIARQCTTGGVGLPAMIQRRHGLDHTA